MLIHCDCERLKGAWQSHPKGMRLPRRFTPRNGHNTHRVLL